MVQPGNGTSPYVAETLALLGDRDPIAVLDELPEWLTSRLDDLPESALAVAEAPGKWSITEVLAHLADDEYVQGGRIRLLLTADRPSLVGFDERRWAERFDYAGADPAEAFHVLTMLRQWNLRVYRGLTPEELGRSGNHSEQGEVTLDRVLRLAAGHDLRHRRQIERIIAVLV